MTAPLRLALGLSLSLAVLGCGHKPPYRRGQQPQPQLLLEQTAPKLPALTISDASITVNRLYRASAAMLAQTPGRFRGTVTKAGNELVTLAFHENGYALRYKFDQFPQGFYHGPPHPCAVEAMIGVPFSYEGLVALVLGGAPLLEEPYEVLEQTWDRKGYEKLIIGNDRFVQELRFAYTGGSWRFTGAVLWQRLPGGDKGPKLWTLHHEELEDVGGVVLPERTSVRAEGPDDDTLVIIRYKERDLNPAWAQVVEPEGPTDDNGDGDQTDGGDHPWGDDGEWEDDGWETGGEPTDDVGDVPPDDSGGGAEAEQPSAETSGPPSEVAAAPVSPPTADEAKGPEGPGPVPPVFFIDGAGLIDRGDLCRGARIAGLRE